MALAGQSKAYLQGSQALQGNGAVDQVAQAPHGRHIGGSARHVGVQHLRHQAAPRGGPAACQHLHTLQATR